MRKPLFTNPSHFGRMTDRQPDIPDISKIKCEDCRYSVDNVNEERPEMRFCAISGHALNIMDKGLPIWGCPIKDAYMQKREKKGMTEQGEIHGWEYKRTGNDFRFRWLEQDNCVCSICHGTGAKIEFEYVTRNYESARRKGKICKNLQAHEHSFWICPICLLKLDSKANAIKERVKKLFRERSDKEC